MGDNPYILLFGLFFALFLGAKGWRQRKLKRATRNLPTRLRRVLGEAPDFDPPETIPEGLEDFADLHRRTAVTMRLVWVVAFCWLAFAIFLVLRKQFL